MHQRRCRVIEKMDEDQWSEFEFLNDDVYTESTNKQMIDIDQLVNIRIKPGVRLPRSQDDWTVANDFFKTVFGNFHLNQTAMDSTIEFMNRTIYDYFADLYGTVNSTNHANTFCTKYKHLTTKSLKHTLMQLKMNDTLFEEI